MNHRPVYRTIFPALRSLLTCLLLIYALHAIPQVIINEVCTHNGNTLSDENGDYPDWIELYNASADAVSLGGFALADRSGVRWIFPARNLPSGAMLVVFASGKDRKGDTLHTSFSLSKDYERLSLYRPDGSLSDLFEIRELHFNHSRGRSPDGASGQFVFALPTPSMSNLGSVAFTAYAEPVEADPDGGFYDAGRKLMLSCATPDAVIRYTLDGSEPSESSAIFAAPFTLDTSLVIRAKAFTTGNLLPTEVLTNTYIIGFPSSLPVFSISIDPYYLWSSDSGMYELGPGADSIYPYHGANFWQDWEFPAHIEFFGNVRKLVFEQDAGLSINGGSVSRTRPQKAFRLTARDRYGASSFRYRFFPERRNDDFKVLVLRNSSGDWNKTHFRDGFLHRLMLNETRNDVLAYRPVNVFLNGQYWGVLNLREKVSKHYLKENHKADKENLDILEEDSTVIQGDFTEFNRMHQYVTTHDMSIRENFDSAGRMIDMNNLTDYYICETYWSNTDWPYNNMKFWRERKEGARWRYITIDLDISLGNNGWAPAELNTMDRILGPYGDSNRHVQIFRSLLADSSFRHDFINRYADLVNTLFTSANVRHELTEVMEMLRPEIVHQFEKWGNTIEGWYYEIDSVVFPYVDSRPALALQHLQEVFLLGGRSVITLDVWPTAGGSIALNSVRPGPFPWSGTYFSGHAISLKAIPENGFVFSHWESSSGEIIARDSEMIRDPADCVSCLAVFLPEDQQNKLLVYPNPLTGPAVVAYELEEDSEVSLQLTDPYGRVLMSSGSLYGKAGLLRFSIDLSEYAAGLYFLILRSEKFVTSSAIQLIR